jgi:signal transduction histidine kinase
MNVFKSFYGRLSLLFMALIVVLGLGMYALVAPAFVSFLCETDQRVNYDLAAEMAAEFEPLLVEGIDHEALSERIAYLTGINPRIDIYLLGPDGEIRASFAREDAPFAITTLNTAPLDAYMAGGTLPIWGQDPFRPGERRPFAAAPISIAGEGGNYVYVVLGSERYYTVAGALRQSYIMQGSMRGIGYVLLLSVGTGMLLFFLVTRRLRAVNDVVGRFARGELESRIEDDGTDELGQLAASFNRMADAIVANLKDLEQTDRLRRELIANVSHDLRSPLASIQGYVETIQIKDDTLTPAERREHMEVVVRNARRLNRLVSELFELSKLEARQVEPQFETFSLAELVQDLVMQFKPQAEARGIRLRAEMPEKLTLVHADIALVERALGNLIENAIRYSPDGGCVKVVPAEEVDRVRVEVCDTGKGISEHELPRVFERYHRSADHRTRDEGGLGLGLAIARMIADLHGAPLTVSSRPGEGTRFGLSLPTG